MPELPEVETIVRGLKRQLINKKISRLKVFSPTVVRSGTDLRRIRGAKITDVGRRGKNILIFLDKNGLAAALIIHLRMTGRLGGTPLSSKHLRFAANFTDGTKLGLWDARKFARIEVAFFDNKEDILSHLGPEPFSLSLAELAVLVARRPRKKIKDALLDQRFIAGIGNIYADEILWAAKIHPQRRLGSLGKKELAVLIKKIGEILRRAIRSRGTSLRDYRDYRGKRGGYMNKLQVYGRAGRPCPRCGKALSKIKNGGRGTHFCPRCQKRT